MTQINTPNGKVKLIYRRSRTSTKVVVLVAVVLSILSLTALCIAISATRADTEQLRQDAMGLERENSRLEMYIEQLGTIEGIIRIAQEELGLIEPGSVIIQPE